MKDESSLGTTVSSSLFINPKIKQVCHTEETYLSTIYLLPFSFRHNIHLIFKHPHCTKERAKDQRGQVTFKDYFQLVIGGLGILLGWPDNKSLYHSAVKGMVEG